MLLFAGIAQWQSICFVSRWLRVQVLLSAPIARIAQCRAAGLYPAGRRINPCCGLHPGGEAGSIPVTGDAAKAASSGVAYKDNAPPFRRNSSVVEHLLGMQATGVRSPVPAPFRICSPTGRDTRLRSAVLGVRITPDAPIRCRSLIGKGHPLKKGSMRVRILPTAPAPFAKRPRHRFYTPTFRGSNPRWSTRL